MPRSEIYRTDEQEDQLNNLDYLDKTEQKLVTSYDIISYKNTP